MGQRVSKLHADYITNSEHRNVGMLGTQHTEHTDILTY